MKAFGFSLVVVVATGTIASADPFHIRYEAFDAFPEEDGWARLYSDVDGTTRRTVSGNVFRLDTSEDPLSYDFYRLASQMLAPSIGERLVVTWSMRTLFNDGEGGRSDVTLTVVTLNHMFVELRLGATSVLQVGERGVQPDRSASVRGGEFNEFRLESADMQHYELFVNSQPAFTGEFFGYAWGETPRVSFGDTYVGLSSISEWRFVDVAVVPESHTSVMFVLGSLGIAFRVGSRR